MNKRKLLFFVKQNALRSKATDSLLFSLLSFHWKKSRERTERRDKNEEWKMKSTKRKKPLSRLLLFGGELGIRTLGAFLHTAFRVLHLRPLGQLSIRSNFSRRRFFIPAAWLFYQIKRGLSTWINYAGFVLIVPLCCWHLNTYGIK